MLFEILIRKFREYAHNSYGFIQIYANCCNVIVIPKQIFSSMHICANKTIVITDKLHSPAVNLKSVYILFIPTHYI